MKVEIEVYRGWSISFDTDKETFYCYSDTYDNDQTKKTYSAIKKYIDDFIKENDSFIPFIVETIPSIYNDDKRKTIIGIRKDGMFVYEENGEKKQLSKYSEKDYVIYNPDNDEIRMQAKLIEDKIEILRLERKEILSKFSATSLTDYKKSLLGQ